MNSIISISPPVVWLDDPYYLGVIVELYHSRTRANVYIGTATAGLRLVSRTSYSYDLRDYNIVWNYFETWVVDTHTIIA